MSRSKLCKPLVVLLTPCLLTALWARPAAADWCGWGCKCPVFDYCLEKAPKMKHHKVCPKPVCDPCTLEHYGYYPTCWHPWPFPPDYSHCPLPGPFLAPGSPVPPLATPQPGSPPGGEVLPPPMKGVEDRPGR